jgi:HK97 family phage major capsid protein
MQHSSTNDAFSPSDFGTLLNTELQSESVALQMTSVVKTDKVSITFPIWDQDPAVNWLTELGTITATDGNTEGVTVIPRKVGGITRLSNELAEDSSPEVASLAVRGLVNQSATASTPRSSATPPPTDPPVCCRSRPRLSIPARRSPTPIRS